MFGTSLAIFYLFIYLQNKVRQSQIEFSRVSTVEEQVWKVHLLLFIRNNNPMFGTIFFFHKLGILFSKHINKYQ